MCSIDLPFVNSFSQFIYADVGAGPVVEQYDKPLKTGKECNGSYMNNLMLPNTDITVLLKLVLPVAVVDFEILFALSNQCPHHAIVVEFPFQSTLRLTRS